MRKILPVLLLLCFATAANANPMWHAEGRTLVDGNGVPVHMRGVSLGNWLLWEGWMFGGWIVTGESKLFDKLSETLGPQKAAEFRTRYYDAYVTEADIAAIAAAGFNTIRLPINSRLLRGNAPGFVYIDHLLGWAHAHGLHVILDIHAVPGAQSSIEIADPPSGGAKFWTDPADRAELVKMWSALATRYRNSETVGGYDLINEPVADDPALLNDIYRRLIAAVRAVDPNHIIWLEGNKMASDFSLFTAPAGANIGYSPHMYTFLIDNRAEKLHEDSELSARLNAPIWIGEFGEDEPDKLASSVAMMDKTPGVVGWTFWTWKRAPALHPSLCVFTVPPEWKKVVGWLTGSPFSFFRPEPADVQTGTEALLKAVRFGHCKVDQHVVGALMHLKAKP